MVTKDRGRAAPYLERLHKEIAMQGELFDADRPVTQLHWGGGTPTFISHDEMAELGAEVVKIEPPQGDALRTRAPLTPDAGSYAFEVAAAQKHSVCVAPDAYADTLDAVAARSDVLLIEAAHWRTLRAEGMTPETIRQRHPHLLVCIVSPHGLHEPEHTWMWSELRLQASAGLMTTTGFHDDPPEGELGR